MPLAVDTNVLARALAHDGSAQAVQARQVLLENAIFVSDGVLLETEWVWRSRLQLNRTVIGNLLGSLLSTDNVLFEDRSRLMKVILAYRNGLDFADAMHLFAAKECAALITFDETFIRRSRKVEDAIPVRRP